jgi:RNA polymerase sigma factor (sigma-70 family)
MAQETQDAWGSYRPYLELLARSTVPADRRGRIDLSSAVQETLARSVRRGDTVQLETEAQRREFLQKTLFDILTDRLVSDSRTVPTTDGQADAADVTLPGPLLVHDELLNRLARVIETLSPEEREALEAHFVDGSTQAKIAERLGGKQGMVAGLIARGVEKLQQQLFERPSLARAMTDVQTIDHEGQVDQVLTSYIESLDTGRPLDRDGLLTAHPDLAPELSRFFAGYDATYLWLLPLKTAARSRGDAQTVTNHHLDVSPLRPLTVRIGRYELAEVLGSGGQGVVYKALQRGAVDRAVALKTLRAEGLATQNDVARFLKEMRLMTELDNPGLVSILDSGIEDGRPFLIMPLMVGGSLANLLKDRGLPDVKTAAKWLAEIARAVDYLHTKHMIHRDLKPSNILFDAQGQARVADFGLLRLVEQAGGTVQPSAGIIEGTASYMAPEQAKGRNKAVGPATDVYGMGAILYEILTGRPPFRSDSFIYTLAQVLEDEPESPRRLRPEVPAELEAICLKCLSKDPGDRYESAGNLADELDRFRHGLPLRLTHPPGFLVRLGQWARREPGLAARLFVVIGCVVVIGANSLSAALGLYQPRKTGWSIGPFSGGPNSLRWVNLTLLFAWGLAAVGFQASLRRKRRVGDVIRAWLSTDVVLATILLIIDGHPVSPLTAVYQVLIAASGLWSRVGVVAFTTALSMIGYLVLIAEGWANDRPIGFRYWHLDFLASLALLGLITAYQVKRVRAVGTLNDDGPES